MKGNDKLQKVLANMGIGSRREMEQAIIDGCVKVDGSIATIGDRVSEQQEIRFNNKIVKINKRPRKLLMYNKPVGVICSKKDEQNRKNAFEILPKLSFGERWVMIGRLDINSQGLLLFTNDGELANCMMHPKYKIARIYRVRVGGIIPDKSIDNLLTGVKLEDGIAKIESINFIRSSKENAWYEIKISSGKNRIIRRILAAQNIVVSKLIRHSYGEYRLPSLLKVGQYQLIENK